MSVNKALDAAAQQYAAKLNHFGSMLARGVSPDVTAHMDTKLHELHMRLADGLFREYPGTFSSQEDARKCIRDEAAPWVIEEFFSELGVGKYDEFINA